MHSTIYSVSPIQFSCPPKSIKKDSLLRRHAHHTYIERERVRPHPRILFGETFMRSFPRWSISPLRSTICKTAEFVLLEKLGRVRLRLESKCLLTSWVSPVGIESGNHVGNSQLYSGYVSNPSVSNSLQHPS